MVTHGYRGTGLLRDGPAPLLSIVIPAYNVAPYLGAAIDSALDQSFTDLEVIVVDDGSTDATPALLEDLFRARNDPRLRIVRQDNSGLSAARNTGIRVARGALVGFLDGDDIWLPEKAAAHIRAMQRDSSIGISFSDSEYLTEEGRRTGLRLCPGKARPSLHAMIRRNHVGNGSTPIVRRACFDVAGLFQEQLRSCEDYQMWCRILWMTSYRAELVNEPLTLYRLRATSLTFDFEKFLRNADRAMALLRAAMPNVPKRVFRAGHAEHYRIAAWKAVSTGQTNTGLRLLARALRMRPSLVVSDWRAVGTAFASVMPAARRQYLVGWVKALQSTRTRVSA